MSTRRSPRARGVRTLLGTERGRSRGQPHRIRPRPGHARGSAPVRRAARAVRRARRAGFDDIQPRQGVVLAYLEPDGIRASELARLSGQHKQVVGTVIDDLERLGYVERAPDPADRRAKLVHPTARGRRQMAAAEEIMAAIEGRHAEALGPVAYEHFKAALRAVTERQRDQV
ncbi:MarR family transcriptional regulator [Streptomyces sp. M19]